MSASPPSIDAVLLIANSANGNCLSQSSLRPLAYARSVSPITPLARSTLALVFLWYDDKARAYALHEGPNARELGVVIHDEHVGEPGSGAETHVANDLCSVRRSGRCPRGSSMHLTREKVHVILDHALAGPPSGFQPDRCPAFELRIDTGSHPMPRPRPMESNPAAVVGKPAIQSTPIIPPRRVGRGSGWIRPRGPPRAAFVR